MPSFLPTPQAFSSIQLFIFSFFLSSASKLPLQNYPSVWHRRCLHLPTVSRRLLGCGMRAAVPGPLFKFLCHSVRTSGYSFSPRRPGYRGLSPCFSFGGAGTQNHLSPGCWVLGENRTWDCICFRPAHTPDMGSRDHPPQTSQHKPWRKPCLDPTDHQWQVLRAPVAHPHRAPQPGTVGAVSPGPSQEKSLFGGKEGGGDAEGGVEPGAGLPTVSTLWVRSLAP